MVPRAGHRPPGPGTAAGPPVPFVSWKGNVVRFFKPLSTLAVGMVLGYVVLPKILPQTLAKIGG